MPASLWPAPSGRGHQSALERLRRDLSGHRFPNLYKALARGDWSDYQSCFIDPTEAWFSSYLYDEPVQLSVEQPPPWAMLQAPSAPETFAANTRFFVSPVHLQLSREGVYLIPPDELQLSEQDHIHLWDGPHNKPVQISSTQLVLMPVLTCRLRHRGRLLNWDWPIIYRKVNI